MAAINPILKIKNIQKEKVAELEQKLTVEGANKDELNKELIEAKEIKDKLMKIIAELNSSETNKNLKKMLEAEIE